LKKMDKTEKSVFQVGLRINDSEVKIFTDEMKKLLDNVANEFNTNKKRIDLFKTLFDTTGDFNLSKQIADSIEGAGTTDIETALNRAFKKSMEGLSFDTAGLFDSKGNVDIKASQAEINKLDPKSEIRIQAQKQLDIVKEFKAKEYGELLKGLNDFESYEMKRTKLVRDGEVDRARIRAMQNTPESVKSDLMANSQRKQDEGVNKLGIDQFKGSATWAAAFGDLDKVSKPTLERLKGQLKELKESAEGKALPITEMEALTKTIEDLEAKTAKFDLKKLLAAFKTDWRIPELTAELEGFTGILKKANEENDKRTVTAVTATATKVEAQKKYDLNPTAENNAALIAATNAETEANNRLLVSKKLLGIATENQKNADKALTLAEGGKKKATTDAVAGLKVEIDSMNEIKNAAESVIAAFYATADALGITFSPETKAIIDGITKGIGAVVAILTAVSAILLVIDSALAPIIAVIWPLLLAMAALIAAFAIFKAIKLNGINDQIETQANLVKKLEKQYAELERTMGDALGTDWIVKYNQELVNLSQTTTSLSRQVALEKSKGKDADQTKIDDLTKSIDETNIKILESSKKLQNFISGTDLSSAANDFASAWLDAYKSFGSTADAMTAKFKEMINTMIVNTLLSKAMMIALAPVFTAMEQAANPLGDGGAGYTPAELAGIVKLTTDASNNSNATLTLIMESLKKAGIEVRDTTSNLTGVSKGITGITEDTALLLGGYLNSIRYKLFAYIDAKATDKAFDMAGSMASLMVAQNTQISHLTAISGNTLRSAIANEKLTDQLERVTSLTGSKGVYSLNVNT